MRLSVNNWLLLLSALLLPFFGSSQGQNWDDLSAKEKAELARQEQMEASRDAQFLDLMDEGHSLFEARKYLQSIRKYEKAGELRPLNVYPPVIIRDIELSMKDTLEVLREREKEMQKETPEEDRIQPEKPLPDREEEMAEFREKEKERQQKVDNWEEKQRRQLARERALKKEEDQKSRELVDQKGRDVRETSMEEFQRDLADQYSSGVTQRTYEEGQRKITERIVVKGNVGNEYKKVEHAWGGKFYFKNGSPISEETWNQETN